MMPKISTNLVNLGGENLNFPSDISNLRYFQSKICQPDGNRQWCLWTGETPTKSIFVLDDISVDIVLILTVVVLIISIHSCCYCQFPISTQVCSAEDTSLRSADGKFIKVTEEFKESSNARITY